MCLPIPHLVGKVDVEERRPKSWNEPRRKRLNFVKDHHDRRSDEWALAQKSAPNQQPRNEQERWDLRQWEAQNRFQRTQLQFDQHRRVQQMQQAQQMQQLYGPRQPMHPHQGQQRQMPLGQHAHHDSDDQIVEIMSSSDSDSDSDHPGNHDRRKRTKVIEMKPKKHHGKMPKQIKMAKTKKNHWADDTDSDDSHEAAFRRLSRSRSRARSGHRSRSRPRVLWQQSDSDESSVVFVKNLGGKHRGRR
ncbi:uncharacterized protein KY384_001572 [Bacidia gigantensis]|uniref:uncharacterized protein n=1 Tax=Bacidia gigantensis TaxID=2732470 RepID=UPI001D059E27|nr:uncharacterized protein KY384_001572 [Bacidia gigantensis]KAG8533831.1 hypothetical protein KY384_001572 [Bacidia gigantensis]